MISRTCLDFMIAIMVYEWRAYIDVHYETPTMKNMTKLDLGPTVFKLYYFYHFNEEIFVSFIRWTLI